MIHMKNLVQKASMSSLVYLNGFQPRHSSFKLPAVFYHNVMISDRAYLELVSLNVHACNGCNVMNGTTSVPKSVRR